MDHIIVLRLAERMLSVLIGGMAIYLGYRLFLAIPNATDAEGRFKLPWNTSIVLSRIGPGVFFALFGSVIVGSSLFRSITYDQPTPQQEKTASMGRFIGASSAIADRDARADAQMRLQRDIAILNI